MQGAFIHFITILANLLTLSATIGLTFGILVQPRRERTNWLFSLFLLVLTAWAGISLLLRVPGMSLLGDNRTALYLYLTFLSLIPPTFFRAVIEFCQIRERPIQLLVRLSLLLVPLGLILLWGGLFVQVEARPRAPAEIGLPAFSIAPIGYVALALMLLYVVVAVIYLRRTPGERSEALRLPAGLLLVAFAGDFIPPLAQLPFDTVLTTLAAVLMGYSIIYQQLFNPLARMNEQLTDANRSLRDMIFEVAAEKERAETLNAELRATSQYKNEFLAKMSHELRTPLNSIVGYSELLLQGIYGDLNDKQSDRLEKIHRNGRDLLALINDVLDLSKIEAGRLELVPQSINLRDHLIEVAASFGPNIEQKGLRFDIELAEPAYPVFADSLRLRQVLNNLMNNAVKFTHEGAIGLAAKRIEVRNGFSEQFPLPVRGWLSDGRWVVIQVSDTGIGIAPENQARIFDEFRQVDSTSTREYGGTGLGLAITRKLVEMHGGQIWVNSAVNAGSTFYVALPASSAASAVPEPPSSDISPNGQGAHVLVIDDSQEAIDILSTYLQEGGYQVSSATSGQEGITQAIDLLPDIITVDIMMPDMTGWQVMEKLRADPMTASIPIIVVSIVDQQPTEVSLGAAAHISKPVDRELLLSTIDQILHGRLIDPILVVDDNPEDLEVISIGLRNAAYPVETCTGGKEAIEWLARQRASLVVLDLLMPEVSGFDVLAHLRETPTLCKLPVLIATAKDLTPDEERFIQQHIARIIKKQGTTGADLLAQIHSLLH